MNGCVDEDFWPKVKAKFIEVDAMTRFMLTRLAKGRVTVTELKLSVQAIRRTLDHLDEQVREGEMER